MLNLTPDHLERHKTMKNYAMTKCSLLSHMTGTKLGLLCFGKYFYHISGRHILSQESYMNFFPEIFILFFFFNLNLNFYKFFIRLNFLIKIIRNN